MNFRRGSAAALKRDHEESPAEITPRKSNGRRDKSPESSQRKSPRKSLAPRLVTSLSSLDTLAKLTRGGELIQVSSSGILLVVKRDDLIPTNLRRNLNLDSLVGTRVLMHLKELDLEISGKVARTRYVGKDGFEIGIDYSDDAPEYWRECLVDLLPAPGEMEDEVDD